MRHFWTTRELAIVREHYPQGGVDACLPHLNRPRSATYQKAAVMKLHAPGQTGCREHYATDPEIDAALKRLHETPLLKGAMVEFADRAHRPLWWVSRRARELGLKTPRFKESPWTDAEIELLHETAHLSTGAAQARFKKRGFKRSETAIVVKRKRMGISVKQAKQDAGLYNVHQCAELLGVDDKTVMRWVRMGELPAKHQGDFWMVTERELRAFIITYPLRVQLRKIPDSCREWFIELVAGPHRLAQVA